MKIVTVNLPEAYIKTIAGLVGDDALYPSRSELIRVATREFLLKELEIAKNFPKFQESSNHIVPEPLKNDDPMTVRVPVERLIGNEVIKEYRTFKIIKR